MTLPEETETGKARTGKTPLVIILIAMAGAALFFAYQLALLLYPTLRHVDLL